jgi:hypothetical protein
LNITFFLIAPTSIYCSPAVAAAAAAVAATPPLMVTLCVCGNNGEEKPTISLMDL